MARLLANGLGRAVGLTIRPAQVNGSPALVLRLDGVLDTVVAAHVHDGRITGLYAVRNPEKLSRMERETSLHR